MKSGQEFIFDFFFCIEIKQSTCNNVMSSVLTAFLRHQLYRLSNALALC